MKSTLIILITCLLVCANKKGYCQNVASDFILAFGKINYLNSCNGTSIGSLSNFQEFSKELEESRQKSQFIELEFGAANFTGASFNYKLIKHLEKIYWTFGSGIGVRFAYFGFDPQLREYFRVGFMVSSRHTIELGFGLSIAYDKGGDGWKKVDRKAFFIQNSVGSTPYRAILEDVLALEFKYQYSIGRVGLGLTAALLNSYYYSSNRSFIPFGGFGISYQFK